MTPELSTSNYAPNCPDCGQRLSKSELESTYTEEKFLCTNPNCLRKYIIVKTDLGKAAQVAPVVMAAGMFFAFLGQILKNRDD